MPATELLYGRNAVREALRAGRRRPRRLLVAAGARGAAGGREGEGGALRALLEEARRAALPVLDVPRAQLERAAPGVNHQGVLLEADPYPYARLDDLPAAATRDAPPPLFLALDQLQDPQNVGTLLRTAEATGVDGVLIPEHRAAAITPAVVNASSGATEWLRVAPVTNLARALARLKEEVAGLWVAGLEGVQEAEPLGRANLGGALALVVGNEGHGIARLVRAQCDFLVRLPQRGRIASLNAAVAGSVALYAIDRRRHGED
jgi:23S rRNA (guanosine2251-2'-O)-methyltransferase